MANAFIVEGLDRMGKGTLIQGIMDKLGFFQRIHYLKPEFSPYYEKRVLEAADPDAMEMWEDEVARNALCQYQEDVFTTGFDILNSNARVIMDRFHLGEVVYAPIYRKYSGNYVYELEKQARADRFTDVRMILLITSDFSFIKEDGNSFHNGDIAKMECERELFIQAFNKSILPNKKIIDVSDGKGFYRDASDILDEALA